MLDKHGAFCENLSMTSVTPNTIAQILTSRMETNLDAVMESLKKHDGKAITTRLEKQLPEVPGEGPWRLRRAYGMTHLDTQSYWFSQGSTGISLLLGYFENASPLNVAWVEDHNNGYFNHRRIRNAGREQTLRNVPLLSTAADVVMRVQAAVAALDAAKSTLAQLLRADTGLASISNDLELLAGLRDLKGNRRT
jgi:hypothetical protein